MTLSTSASRADFTGNSCTLAYPYTFKIQAASDLDVFVDGVQQTLTTHYSVSGAGSDTGGTVTFVTAPGCVPVALVRDIPYTQATDYNENDPFPAAAHEDALDKLTMLIQQVLEFATRAWRFAAGSPFAAAGYVVDEPACGRYARVKADCSGIEFVALTATGTYADPVTTKGDLIVGSALGCQERLGITLGSQLVASPVTGRPSWQPGLMVQAVNKVDAALAAGDVVALDTGCDRAVALADTQGCTRVFVVAPEAVGDDCTGVFLLSGLIRNVKAQGTIARGRYVRKSATTKAVEDAGATLGATPPAGTLGVSVTAAAGGMVDVVFTGLPTGTVNPPPTIDLSPLSAAFAGASASPVLTRNLGAHAHDYSLDFDNPSTEQCCTWEVVLRSGLSVCSAMLYVMSRQPTACAGTVGWICRTRAVTDAGIWDAAYTNCDVVVAQAVKATAGVVLLQCTTLSVVGWTCASRLRVKLLRDVGADTVAERVQFIGGWIEISS